MQRAIKKIFLVIIAVFAIAAGFYAVSLWDSVASAQNETLYWGKNGDEVARAQRKLDQWGYYDGAVDGVFGNKTSAAVKEFQRQNGLRVDGVVGPSTWSALGFYSETTRAARADTSSRAGTRDRNGVYLLAKVINGEARGEPYLGKVAVGAVIMNRVQSASFPNTMAGVIYQNRAFESVANGQYNTALDEDSLKAARQVMNGWDPTNGALYFWNPAKSVSPWIWTRTITMRIGKHVFGI